MELNELKQHIDTRLDKLDSKLERMEDKQDKHLERITAAEVSINWLRGSVKVGVTVLLAVVTGLINLIYQSYR